ncbi:MAG: Gfo/Idh/MocA family oxidoreductase [Bacteroidales bacterium]|nr:Gfo/Idh/MocA family oxidoreductase [Bacteroidales bacterium]
MKKHIILFAALLLLCVSASAREIRLGIIGLDTSHSTAFSKLLNDPVSEDPYVRRFQVVAAYPYGTMTIESAAKRIPQYIEEVKTYGVEVVTSIAELLDRVDFVLIETNDGRLHLEQALEVFKAGKGCYIDKPLGATLGEVMAIYQVAEQYGTPVFSSSALRFSPENVWIRKGAYGPVKGADVYSPHHPEPTHPDFGYYGIHGVETLFTVMGTGCQEVVRMHTEEGDIVTGRWADGRLGTFRAIVTGPNLYGGTVIVADKAVPAGGYVGYLPLLHAILDFFETGIPPVGQEETLEMFAFMKASNMSLERGGRPVSLKEAIQAGRKDARKILKTLRRR